MLPALRIRHLSRNTAAIFPKVGVTVMTRVGQGRVVAQGILARKVLVRYEGSRDVLTEEREILTVIKSGQKQGGNLPGGPPGERSAPDRN